MSGTFNVPTVSASSTDTDTSEWVGIDGVDTPNLIQAGVEESYDHAANLVRFQAWWEILPATETPISLQVRPGDQVTVAIGQVAGSLWRISITNNTTGQTFSTTQTYAGTGTTADWIVEAPTVGDAIATLGQYTPNVTFTNLKVSTPNTSVTRVLMGQGGAIVSTPSDLTANGFTVAYGPAAPTPP